MDSYLTLVVFALDDKRYALPLSSVERVVRSVEITALPKAPEIVSGIINVQGTVIPVFNIRKRFRLPEKEIDMADQMIVAKTSSRTVSFGVDEVEGVLEWPGEKIIAGEKIHPEVEYVEGVIKLDNGMVLVHDLDRFLSLDEGRKLDNALRGKKPQR
jgi:purine-binding chemotaxis protein CheW